MNIHSHSKVAATRPSFILFLLAQIVAVPALAAQNWMHLAALRTPLSPQFAVVESFDQKTETSRSNPNLKEPLYITVINMSGQPRQAALCDSNVDLPVAQRVVLEIRPGDTLRVVSSTNSKIEERFVISERDAARLLIVQ
jgi:hypothetical protein